MRPISFFGWMINVKDKFSINGFSVFGGVKIPTRDAVDGGVRCPESG